MKTGKRIQMLPGYNTRDGRVRHLYFLPDSRSLYSVGDDSITLWDTQTGKIIRQRKNEFYLMMSPDGRKVAVNRDQNLLITDPLTGKILSRFLPPPTPLVSLAFSPDGKQLASGGEWSQTALRVWDLEKGRLRFATGGPRRDLFTVRFLPGNRVLIDGFNQSQIRDAGTGELLSIQNRLLETYSTGTVEGKWGILTPDAIKMVSESDAEDQSIDMGELGSRLVKRYPDFDVRNYGDTKLSKFLKKFDFLEIRTKGKGTSMRVSLKSEAEQNAETQPAKPRRRKARNKKAAEKQ
jgi:WD40 repeat protein